MMQSIFPHPSQSTLRILVAEDNPVNQMVILRLLEKLGYEADIAANGLEVLESLTHHPYDVVLMDLFMPEMNGIETAYRICQDFHPSIRPRIIAVTAGDQERDRQQCLEAGMDDFISKPIRMEELARVLGSTQPLPLLKAEY